ncbi:hypothetical protein BCR32DRAFT_330447 [Anaeromyces robustus]|uniref:Carbohydrate esterase 2 N-terminal domain-containing protein n=1 Tax=Anaeromyces robustus TaxID=1754192 RepID=A0A1Y1VUT4_9FUNG|nr:hypothetical protein BCR32DRAFT_330447 [Anaeromyces robustus]|eukprot:ORX65058.1 hypothetical protein BCR32DRAFT_330447 [Anaeromyces robustus]
MDCNKLNNSCSDNNKLQPQLNSFKPTKDNVKILGRTLYQNGSLWVSHTDSSIEFKFTGKICIIVISTDSIYGSLSEENPAHIFVYGDDKQYIDVITTKSIMELKIEFDEIAEHVIRLMKVSECHKGSIYINEIKTDSDSIRPTAAKNKKIEFIGDSITCAFGALDTEGEFTTRTEDGTKSYAYKVAQKFDVDYSIFGFSGYGIYSGFSFNGIRNPDFLVPPHYDKLGELKWNEEHPEATNIVMANIKWDASEFIPDLIVINLGTNDDLYVRYINDEKTKEIEKINFSNEYKKFIKHVRSIHPNSEILCTIGVMGQDFFPLIENVVSTYCKETNDNKINVFKFNIQNIEKNGIGIMDHPNALSQVDAAIELIEEIEKRYGWKSNPNIDITEK